MIKKIAYASSSLLILGLFPLVTSAQRFVDPDYIFVRAGNILYSLMALVFGIATLIFMWGVIQYVISGGDEKKVGAARTYMLYGIIGLSVMAGVWGFVNLLLITLFNGQGLSAPGLPGLFGGGGGLGGGQNECAPGQSVGQDLQCVGAVVDAIDALLD